MIIVRPCDLETTGTEPTDEVIELAAYDIRDGQLEFRSAYHVLVKPMRPIPPAAMAIHHITDEDLVDAPLWDDAWRMLQANKGWTGEDYPGTEIIYAAHVAEYERQYLDKVLQARWICSWKCALRQWPDLSGHTLQELRYALKLPVLRDIASPPHRAPPDAYVCGLLVLELLKHQSIETLLQWSAEPAIFLKFNFGQFDGQPLSAADDGYIDWLANKEHKMGEHWRWNARVEHGRRLAAKRVAYAAGLMPAIAAAASVSDLQNWYSGRTEEMARNGLLLDTPEYASVIAACKARKAAIIAAGGAPQFGDAT